MKDPDIHKRLDLDRVLADLNLSKGKSSLSQFYQPWGTVPEPLKNPYLVRREDDKKKSNAQ